MTSLHQSQCSTRITWHLSTNHNFTYQQIKQLTHKEYCMHSLRVSLLNLNYWKQQPPWILSLARKIIWLWSLLREYLLLKLFEHQSQDRTQVTWPLSTNERTEQSSWSWIYFKLCQDLNTMFWLRRIFNTSKWIIIYNNFETKMRVFSRIDPYHTVIL